MTLRFSCLTCGFSCFFWVFRVHPARINDKMNAVVGAGSREVRDGGAADAGAAAVAAGGRHGDRPWGGAGVRGRRIGDGVGARHGDVLLGGRGRRVAAVQLAELKAATQKQVAAGFGTDAVTVWRWADAYRRDGLAGLLPEPKGPRGPSKLTPELTAEIRELRGQGLSQAAVAARCGVSSFAVRTALGTVGSRTAPAAAGAEPAGQEAPAGGAGPEQAGRPGLRDAG